MGTGKGLHKEEMPMDSGTRSHQMGKLGNTEIITGRIRFQENGGKDYGKSK